MAVALLKESVPRVEALSRHLSSLASCLPDALLEETSLGCGYGATAAVRARVAALSEAIEAQAAEAALIRAETMDVRGWQRDGDAFRCLKDWLSWLCVTLSHFVALSRLRAGRGLVF